MQHHHAPMQQLWGGCSAASFNWGYTSATTSACVQPWLSHLQLQEDSWGGCNVAQLHDFSHPPTLHVNEPLVAVHLCLKKVPSPENLPHLPVHRVPLHGIPACLLKSSAFVCVSGTCAIFAGVQWRTVMWTKHLKSTLNYGILVYPHL